jgi:hypothetical protein
MSNRQTHEMWQHSGSTVSLIVEDISFCFERVQGLLFIKSPLAAPAEILNNPKYSPFFDDCIGAFDGCHVSCVTSNSLFRNRKGWMSQNVLAAVNFDTTFSYVLCG